MEESLRQTSRLTFALFQKLLVPLTPRFQLGIVVIRSFVECPRVKVNATVVRVAVPVLYDAFYKGYNFWNVFRYPGQGIRVADAQAVHVIEELLLPIRRKRAKYRMIGDIRTFLRGVAL